MTTYLALLRGINVSGQKKIPMVALREILVTSGFQQVKTYIQSGNVIFRASERNGLEQSIQEIIQEHFGWNVEVLVRTLDELQEVLNGCPFPKETMEKSYFTLLKNTPTMESLKGIEGVSVLGEEFVLGTECIYFYSTHGYGNAKLNNNWFEKKLKVTATSRNFKTISKLVELMQD